MAIRFPDLIGLGGFIALSFFMAFAVDRLHRANDALQRALQQTEQSERAINTGKYSRTAQRRSVALACSLWNAGA